ncbi:Phosphatidylinositol transfer protein CSR1 [Talaromyces islandicus]|uniref:Phosphatidylinositol transfer protein CSR1 n=1 Tax=Talaromyces islandicus TaxID=28573 RepID=A0A0U1LMQ0_TALIS|nr:Phosphatidylinositol transfer protein CSR1 [Talaromyces islandicus]
MQVPTGVLGNLTPDQEARLQQLWMFLLNAFDGPDSTTTNNNPFSRASFDDPPRSPNSFDTSRHSLSSHANNTDLHLPPTPTSPISSTQRPYNTQPAPKKLRRRTSLLSNASESIVARTASTHKRAMSFHAQSMGGVNLRPSPQNAQVMRRIMAAYKLSPDELRHTLLASLKNDHPDAMLLRYLRARKWDVGKAFVLLVSSMGWRVKMHVDDDILPRGELYALQQTKSPSRREQRAGNDFVKQLRMGKNIIHGVDREGRPIVDIRVRLHRAEDQSDAVLERYVVHTIEMCRLLLRPPEIETAVLIFDMTDFSMANMDYTPVKFIIKCLESFYPECLGLILIHKAPWFFSASWRIIKAWMNDSLRSKVHFTKTLGDLQRFIAPENIPGDLGGPDAYHYRYIEPDTNDKAETLSHDTYSPTREFLLGQRQRIASEMLDATRLWLQTSAMRDRIGAALQHDRRVELIEELRLNYWRLDPFVRARSHLDREGVIVGDGIGSVNIYPHRASVDAMVEDSDKSRMSAGSSATTSFNHQGRGHGRELSESDMQSNMQSVRGSIDHGFDFALTSHISDDTETETDSGMSMRDSFMREYDDSMVSEDMISEVDELPAVQPPQSQPQPQSKPDAAAAANQLEPPTQPETNNQPQISTPTSRSTHLLPPPQPHPQEISSSEFDSSDDDFDEDSDVEIHDAVTHMVGGRGSGIVQRAAVRVINV